MVVIGGTGRAAVLMPLVDTNAAAVAVDVKPGVIRKWAHRGHIAKRGNDDRGRALYDLKDVHDAKRLLRARSV